MEAIISVFMRAYLGTKLMKNTWPTNSADVSTYNDTYSEKRMGETV